MRWCSGRTEDAERDWYADVLTERCASRKAENPTAGSFWERCEEVVAWVKAVEMVQFLHTLALYVVLGASATDGEASSEEPFLIDDEDSDLKYIIHGSAGHDGVGGGQCLEVGDV
uniref:Uncharacterized protein n=1 Tax=Hemiselmis andersenii TaxID=464988 RepID=A0A7S1EE43_HEMAN